jgi:hypothetical protein
MTNLKKGDRVTWKTSQGETSGHVIERRTNDFQFARQRFTASSDQPAYIVESDTSGKRAAHKGDALRKA